MSKLLQFRCIDENCPSNYQIMALSPMVEESMEKSGISLHGQAGKCALCGQTSFIHDMPVGFNKQEKIEYNALIEDTVNKMRASFHMMRTLIAGKVQLPPGQQHKEVL